MVRDNPIVSVVMPAYNAGQVIGRALESVLAQSYAYWELIVFDDGSNDNTVDIVSAYAENDRRIQLLENETNIGPAASRNNAIRQAEGSYIAFLDADDTWHPEKLDRQIGFMEKHAVALSFTSYQRITDSNHPAKLCVAKKEVNYAGALWKNPIGCLTAVYSVSMLGKQYMPDIRRGHDYALWLQILRTTDKAYGIDDCLADYHVGSDTVSSMKVSTSRYIWKVYRDVEKLSLWRSAMYFLSYAIHGVIDRL
jgi:glycosyltransferase involved in cell wall biosynthesis